MAAIQAEAPGLHPGRTALIAVSGGRDSAVLLHWLVSAGWKKLIVLHLNHSLRGRSSEADARFVKGLAGKFGLRCEIRQVDVARMAKRQKLSIETAGREARRAFFAALARKHRCKYVFTAHHADDQAETVLHRLCRGTSLAGFGGMKVVAGRVDNLIMLRPMLGVTRAEIDGYIATHGVKYREDKTNASRGPTRNRVRHELLPLMHEIFLRDVSPLIVRFAAQAARDDGFLQDAARAFAGRNSLETRDGALRITTALKKLHPAIASRIVFAWLTGRHRIPTRLQEIETALAMLRGAGSVKMNLPGGAHLGCDGRRLWVERPPVPTTGREPRPRPLRLRK